MIEGEVTPARQGVVRLRVSRPGGPSEKIMAAIDTGFTGFLALPTETIARLGLHLVCCEESRCWKQADRVWLEWVGSGRVALRYVSPIPPLEPCVRLSSHTAREIGNLW